MCIISYLLFIAASLSDIQNPLKVSNLLNLNINYFLVFAYPYHKINFETATKIFLFTCAKNSYFKIFNKCFKTISTA